MGRADRVVPMPDLGDPSQYSYSHCVKVGNLVFIAGQCGVDDKGEVVGDFDAQARQSLNRVIAVVEGVGGTKDDIVAMTVFITDVRLGRRFTEIRREMLEADFPTSALITVSALMPDNAMVEIQATAVLES